MYIYKLAIFSAVLLGLNCSKEDALSSFEGADDGALVPITIVLGDQQESSATRATVTDFNIDYYYLSIDQASDEYDYFVKMQRTYTPASGGSANDYKFNDYPKGVWSDWEAYDLVIESGSIVERKRTEPMYFESLSGSISVKALKWDLQEANILEILNDKIIFSDQDIAVDLYKNGAYTQEEMYSHDLLHFQNSALPIQKDSNQVPYIRLQMNHQFSRLRVNVVYSGNFADLYLNKTNSSGLGHESVISSIAMQSASSNHLDYELTCNLSLSNIVSATVDNLAGGVNTLTQENFRFEDGRWLSSYEMLVSPNQGEAAANCNQAFTITTKRFEVSDDGYTLSSTLLDRTFEISTHKIYGINFDEGKSFTIEILLGDDYAYEQL